MFLKATTIAVVALLAIPAVASATNGHGNKKLAKIVQARKAATKYPYSPRPVHTQASIGHAVHLIGASVTRESNERTGYCAPILMPRVGEQDGTFMNLYADDASRAAYLAAGLVEARKDPITGSLSC